jgi:hypothetical protein
LISDEARQRGFRMIWHKIALRKEVGKADLYRPTYSHMLCYSKKGKIGIPVTDVVAYSDVTYSNGFGKDAVTLVLKYLKANGIKMVYDPFVGSGTTLAVANQLGMHAVGVDIDPIQCRKARMLRFNDSI